MMSGGRSPFRWVTKGDLQMLRTLAVEVETWVDAARAGHYYQPKYAPEILQNSGGIRQAEIIHEFQKRAWKRLEQSPNWNDIADAHNLERLRLYEPQAYQVKMLREELDRHKRECTHRNIHFYPPKAAMTDEEIARAAAEAMMRPV